MKQLLPLLLAPVTGALAADADIDVTYPDRTGAAPRSEGRLLRRRHSPADDSTLAGRHPNYDPAAKAGGCKKKKG